MSFWTYLLHCRGGYFYVGHTDDLDRRVTEHEQGTIPCFATNHRPVKLVWSQPFGSREEALAAERRIKGWSRAKKMALIRDDWEEISRLAKARSSPSTGSGGTDVALLCHPQTPAQGVRGVGVSVSYSAGIWTLRYMVDGGAVVMPPRATPERADGLWQTTCFELFVATADAGYAEFNFAPSTRWAAYRFEGYRAGMADLAVAPPLIVPEATGVTVTLSYPLPAGGARIALSAVIEEADGTRSFWALVHPPGQPDFHHADCFATHMAAGERA